tara:strand:- start:69 stop:404 length:336 start_codon:yes stop_codon:yes gene_type:complete
MFKIKYIFSVTIFLTFLFITSVVKNKTRIIEKQILNLNSIILLKENNLNEAQLDFYYLTSPAEIEKKLHIIGYDNYQPVKYSNIYFDISEFLKINNKISKLENVYEKNNKK